MSLRDQLLAKGLVSAKDARRVDQQRRKEKNQDKAQQRKKHLVEAEEAARRAAEHEAEVERRRRERKEREDARESVERVHRVRQICEANRFGRRGAVPFFHKAVDGRRVIRRWVDERTAFGLRCGELGIAGYERLDGTDAYAIVRRRVAERLREIAPEAVVHLVDDTRGISRPEEAFGRAVSDPTLRAHRATEDAPAT